MPFRAGDGAVADGERAVATAASSAATASMGLRSSLAALDPTTLTLIPAQHGGETRHRSHEQVKRVKELNVGLSTWNPAAVLVAVAA